MSLVSLGDLKSFLNIDLSDTSSDAFLTMQAQAVSEAIETYCQRSFEFATYKETFYPDLFFRSAVFTAVYPVTEIVSIQTADNVDVQGYRLHGPTGRIESITGWHSGWGEQSKITIEYKAGFTSATLPSPLKLAICSLVAQRYNARQAGVALDFGNDIQSISIPGTISIAFDYTLTNNDEDSTFGMILGNWKNAILPYRSDRAVVQSGQYRYVEKVP